VFLLNPPKIPEIASVNLPRLRSERGESPFHALAPKKTANGPTIHPRHPSFAISALQFFEKDLKTFLINFHPTIAIPPHIARLAAPHQKFF